MEILQRRRNAKHCSSSSPCNDKQGSVVPPFRVSGTLKEQHNSADNQEIDDTKVC